MPNKSIQDDLMESKIAELWATYLEVVVAAAAAVGIFWAAIKRIYHIARNVEELVTASESHERRLAAIEAQVTANGGSSLMDAIQRIEASLRERSKE